MPLIDYTGKPESMPGYVAPGSTVVNQSIDPTLANNPLPTAPTSPVTEVAKPTPVVTSAPAVAQLGKAKEAVSTSDASIQKQIDEKKAKVAELQAQMEKQKAAEKTPIPTEKTPEQLVAETPDPGYKFAYNPNDGTKTQIPIEASASVYGMSDAPTAKKEATVEDSVQVEGITYNRLSDGTYTKFNNDTGVGMSATKTDYELSKTAKSNADKLQQIIDGTYPLDPDQLAQIQGLQAQWGAAIKDEQEKNANLSGAEAVMQNLYGMGNQKIGKDAISDVINKGADRVAELNSKMNAAVAQMKAGFKTDNYKLISDAYKTFTDTQVKRQAQFDQMTKDTQTAVAQQKAYDENRSMAVENDIRGLMDTASKTGGMTPEKQKALNEALVKKDYNAAVLAAGDSLINVGGWMGDWYSYKNAMEAQYPGVKVMSPQEFKNWDDNNKLAIAKAGASVTGFGAGGATQGQGVPFQATIDAALDLVGPTIKGSLKNELYYLAQKGDYVTLLTRIKNQTINQLSSANKTKVENAQTALPYLTNLSNKLQEFKDKGGDTSLISGTENDIANKLGILAKKDPTMATIAAQLQGLFFNYRRDMSGAAFSVPESQSYQSINPSAKNTLSLNMALIQGLKNANEQQIDNAFSSKLPSGSYLNLKSKADQQLSDGGSSVNSSGGALIEPLKKAENAITVFGNIPGNRERVIKLMKDNPDANPEEIAAALDLKY